MASPRPPAWPRLNPAAAAPVWLTSFGGPGPDGAHAGPERALWPVHAVPTRVEVHAEPARALERLWEILGRSGARPARGASGGWVLALSYDLGRALEPAVGPARARADGPWPALVAARFEGGAEAPAAPAGGWRAGPLRSRTGREGYTRAVARAVEYIRAGDVYQVNLAHELAGPFEGSASALFAELAGQAAPWYGASITFDEPGPAPIRRSILSLSPELFLWYDAGRRRVVTRPMKGTRPAHASPSELREAEKDRAELDMIVDLMRNDLGRACRFGTVRVDDPRRIERHGSGVLQGTATVSGELRAGLGLADLLRWSFPAGSVTGAPKIRAMQIIDELEPSPRGLYCGSLGVVSDSGDAVFSVAIRTALLSGMPDPASPDGILSGELRYSVGAGIVADSDPGAEWRETLVKARALERCVRIEEAP